jgi:hypothetical protein
MLCWRPTEYRTKNGLHELPWQTMQQRHNGCTQQNQSRSDRHEQQMLNHMDGEQFLVECGKR